MKEVCVILLNFVRTGLSVLSLNGGNSTTSALLPFCDLYYLFLSSWLFVITCWVRPSIRATLLLNPIAPGTRVERESIYWPDKPCVLIEFIIGINIFKIA